MKKIISIILYVIAGFLLYITCFLMFLTFDELSISQIISMLLTFFVFASIPLLVGLKLRGFKNWKRDVGIIMTSVAGVTAFIIFSFTMVLIDPQFEKYMPKNVSTEAFSINYILGLSYLLIFSTIGILLIVTSKKKKL